MDYLKKLVSIKSDNNCDQIIEYLKNELNGKAEDIQVYNCENQTGKILIVGVNTKLSNIEPLVLSGHLDTVSPNVDLYKTNPFDLTEIDGKCYGLGSIDMKSFTAIILKTFKQIKSLDYPIVLAFTTDEETSLNSINLMIDTFEKLNIRPKFTIVGEPTNSQFNNTSNACFEYEVKFYGKACHSSKIDQGINAICASAKLISFIESKQKEYKLTSNCGVIHGGEVVNKVPDYTQLSFDIRSIYPEDVQNFINDIKDYISNLENEYKGIKIELDNILSMPALNMTNNEIIKKLATTLGVQINSFSGGCEAGYFTQYSGDAVIFGVGDLSLAHKPNEFVVIKEFNDYSKQLLNLLNTIKKYYFE